jgi:NDP-sugar pyrophosphorylase family protein
MQAVILAAGRGSRMGKLTEKLPKPMLEVAGKTLLEHKFDALPESVHEIIIIVGYLKETIIEKFGDSYNGKRLIYIEQENIVGGTMDALLQAKEHIAEKFLVMMGDDIYSKEDINAILAHDWALLVQRVPDTGAGGKVIYGVDEHVIDILESGGHVGGEGAINTNMWVLDPRVFTFPPVPKAVDSTELGLPQTVVAASKASGIPLNVVEATRWIQITDPDDLKRAEALLSTPVR